MDKKAKIWIAGHRGMVGSALMRKFQKEGYNNIVTRTSAELDLRNQQQVQQFFAIEKPEYVFLAAARVGGIKANNTFRAEFIYDNLMMEANIIDAAYRNGVAKLLFLGSSCIYPRLASQPLKEESLLTGQLEYTNEPYAIAKIAGIKLCENYRLQYGCDFICAMPTNLYGPNDNYDLDKSHVFPALMQKIVTAKKNNLPFIEVWGTGTPKREFMHVDDLADACLFLINNYSQPQIINVGVGEDVTILELANLIKKIINYKGEITTNPSMPDGTPRKLMDVSRINALGWKASIPLEEGIRSVYEEVKDRF